MSFVESLFIIITETSSSKLDPHLNNFTSFIKYSYIFFIFDSYSETILNDSSNFSKP